jgi:hypothetical protein
LCPSAKLQLTYSINRFNGIIHVDTDTEAGILSRSRPRGVSPNARAQFLSTGVQLCLALQLFARSDSSLLWPCSIRSLQQPLSSSRSIAYQGRALIDQVGKALHEPTRAGFTASEKRLSPQVEGRSGGREISWAIVLIVMEIFDNEIGCCPS